MTRHQALPGHRPGTLTPRAALAGLTDLRDSVWMDRAPCAGRAKQLDPAGPSTVQLAAWAIAVYCDRCPVLAQCARKAGEQAIPTGVWAGRYYTQKDARGVDSTAKLAGHLGRARSTVASLKEKDDLNQLTPRDISRFHASTRQEGDCLVWTGEIGKRGYGFFSIYRNNRRIRFLAHRLALALHLGRMPSPATRHNCDNPPCVRVEHLTEGSQADNIRDALERGRLNLNGLTAFRHAKSAAVKARIARNEKRCNGCETTKTLDDFPRNAGSVDGRGYRCRACLAKRNRRTCGLTPDQRAELARETL